MTLWERLEAKQRRRVTVDVLVSDPARDEEAAARARELWLASTVDGSDEQEVSRLKAALDAAEAAVRGHVVEVEFQSIPAGDLEALVAAFSGDSGEVDRARLLPELAAACAVEEELRDADRWAALLGSPAWTQGEFDHLYHQLFVVLNYSVPRSAAPKG